MAELGPVVELLFSGSSLLLMVIGCMAGVFVGAIPGLTGAMLIALSLPLTFSMNGEQALILLVSMYVGSISGGLITATLLRIPGTPASIMTTLDGYPMAQKGHADRALGLGIGASFIGGTIAWLFLILLAAPMAALSVKFGPFEYFSLVMVALVLIASVGGGGAWRGLLAGFLGILAAMPGTSPASGVSRWTFGNPEMDDGFKLLPVLIGLFAVNQVIAQWLRLNEKVQRAANNERVTLKLSAWRQHAWNLIRSSLIGTWVGILPGIGANIGSALAYSAAKNRSQHPEAFGSGSEEGIVASESANNATVGGALIPLVAMGIPGSVIDAILLGALVIHGLQPGPLLMEQNPLAVHTIMGTLLLANVFTFLFMLYSTRWIARLTQVPSWLMLPVILTFCVIGSYALANRMFDVWVMLAFGVIGFALERAKIPLAPFVIGFVLAPIAEENLSAGLMQSGGSLLPLFTRPISAILLGMAIAMLCWSLSKSSLKVQSKEQP